MPEGVCSRSAQLSGLPADLPASKRGVRTRGVRTRGGRHKGLPGDGGSWDVGTGGSTEEVSVSVESSRPDRSEETEFVEGLYSLLYPKATGEDGRRKTSHGFF